MFASVLKRFARGERGAVIAETGLIAGLLVILLTTGLELSRFIFMSAKLDRVAISMADVSARYEGISEAEMQDVFRAAAHLFAPFELGEDGVVVVTSISADANQLPRIDWVRKGGGTALYPSQFGNEGDVAALPASLLKPDGSMMREGETMIAVEVYYKYTPIIAPGFLEGRDLYRTAYFRPRHSDLFFF